MRSATMVARSPPRVLQQLSPFVQSCRTQFVQHMNASRSVSALRTPDSRHDYFLGRDPYGSLPAAETVAVQEKLLLPSDALASDGHVSPQRSSHFGYRYREKCETVERTILSKPFHGCLQAGWESHHRCPDIGQPSTLLVLGQDAPGLDVLLQTTEIHKGSPRQKLIFAIHGNSLKHRLWKLPMTTPLLSARGNPSMAKFQPLDSKQLFPLPHCVVGPWPRNASYFRKGLRIANCSSSYWNDFHPGDSPANALMPGEGREMLLPLADGPSKTGC
mmetsp:Transcript_1298/g.3088  ORF Transcript_1298/g.3088 Transcript_1298/m.3088 type:complete len:274 (+) Transcript_1298:192-1013(+)